jgi:hypothetical protein
MRRASLPDCHQLGFGIGEPMHIHLPSGVFERFMCEPEVKFHGIVIGKYSISSDFVGFN